MKSNEINTRYRSLNKDMERLLDLTGTLRGAFENGKERSIEVFAYIVTISVMLSDFASNFGALSRLINTQEGENNNELFD